MTSWTGTEDYPMGEQGLAVALLGLLDDALLLLAPDGSILCCSGPTEGLLGLPPGALRSRPLCSLVPPGRQDELEQCLSRLRGGSPMERIETEWQHRDGAPFPVVLTLQPVQPGLPPRPAIVRVDPGQRPQRDTLTLAIEQSPAAVIITDAQGRIEYVNPRFTEMSGYSAGEVVGQTPRVLRSGLTPPEDYARLWGTILGGKVWRGELCNRRKNGELYWHSASISPLRDEGGRIIRFVAVQEDVTESRRMLEALRASEAGFRRIVQTATEGIWQVDAAHRTVFVNSRLAAMLGYSEEGMLGRSVFDFTDEEGRRIAEASWARRKQGIAEQLDFKLRRRDGTPLWVLMSTGPIFDGEGRYAGALAMVTDLTARREAEAALRQSEAYYRALIEQAQDLIAVVGADGIVRYASPSHQRVLGYQPDELVGLSVFGLVHPEDLERISQVFAEAEREPGLVRSLQFRFRHRDGSWRVLEGIGSNLFQDALIQGAVVNSRDVTERVAMEAQLRQAQKIEAVGRLVGGIVHDFNNTLSAILGFSTLVQEDLGPDHPSRPDVDEIRKAGERAAGLNRQLLAFSRQQVLQPRVLDLNDLIGGIQPMLDRLLGEDVTVDLRLAPGPATVLADPVQLEQILVNLAVNSRDAMPEGGRLLIETAHVELDQDDPSHQPQAPGGPYILLAVSDTGTGMDEDTRARAFEPFFTTKAASRGTGLGLSTVYGIVKQSGGFIWLYSEPGHGTTIKVYLPAAPGGPADQEVAAAPQTLDGSETVLLVDDNDAVRQLARRALERYGYVVLDASGIDAVEVARAHQGEIHLLLTDVIMPEIRGPELARRVGAARPGIRVLYVSGFTAGGSVPEGVGEGQAGFLQKPFTPATLAAKVREVLDR